MADLPAVLLQIRDGIARNAYPNETAVRTQIVQPILERLGWPIYDPERVCNEYSLKLKTTTRRIDLALCVSHRNPRCIIELKTTDYDLKSIGTSGGDTQLFEYAFFSGAPLALLTNGIIWRFYSTVSAGTYTERLVRALDISTDPPTEVARSLERYLSYTNTQSEKAGHYALEDRNRRIRMQHAKEKIPTAWMRLVRPNPDSDPDERLIALLTDVTSSLVDTSPAKQDVADFLRRLRPEARQLPPVSVRTQTVSPTKPSPVPNPTDDMKTKDGGASASREIRYHLLGEERVAKNPRAAYIAVFAALASRDSEFLARLAPKLRGRKNRKLARKRDELSSAEVMIKTAVMLPDNWWLLTHLSNKNKMQALKTACEVAGIPFGDRRGFRIVLPNA